MIAILTGLSGVAAPVVSRADGPAPNPCPAPDTPGCIHGLPAFQYEMLLAQMVAHPAPSVRQIAIDHQEIRRFHFYRVNRRGVTLYNAPGGQPIGSIDPGFNFVDVRQREGDWALIEPNTWVPMADLSPVPASSFAGVLIDGPLAYPVAWVLRPTRPSSFPGVPPDEGTPAIARYVRVNLYATGNDGQWDWYLIGPGQWIEQRMIGQIVPIEPPAGVKGRWIAVDLYEQVLVAYEDSQPVFATLISSGLPQWSTNEGLFRIWARLRSDTMSGAMGRPDFYRLPAVPYVMYFDRDIGLHGTYWHDGFGYRHSHGCVNLSVSDARWLYTWTNNFFFDTWVYVWSSGEYVSG
jgi:hypothetical protein